MVMAMPSSEPPPGADSRLRNGCNLPALIILLVIVAVFLYAIIEAPNSAPDPTRSAPPPVAPAHR